MIAKQQKLLMACEKCCNGVFGLVLGYEDLSDHNTLRNDYRIPSRSHFNQNSLLISYLRTSNKDAAQHAWLILSLLVKRFRQVWPNVKIVFRGDSGFCRHQMFDWCERNNVYYITDIAGNSCLEEILKQTINEAERLFAETQEKQRLFVEFMYKAKSWSTERKVIGKAEHTKDGANPRYIVTNLPGKSQDLYDNGYCARGDMKNRIKSFLNKYGKR